jgi:hypothetical protein
MIAAVTVDGSWGWASPELMQRAVHLAALRTLLDQRRIELDRVVAAADALTCAGYVIDREDAPARLEFARKRQRLTDLAEAAEHELRAAESALRAAVLDDAWTPSDDIDGPPTA